MFSDQCLQHNGYITMLRYYTWWNLWDTPWPLSWTERAIHHGFYVSTAPQIGCFSQSKRGLTVYCLSMPQSVSWKPKDEALTSWGRSPWCTQNSQWIRSPYQKTSQTAEHWQVQMNWAMIFRVVCPLAALSASYASGSQLVLFQRDDWAICSRRAAGDCSANSNSSHSSCR